MAYRESPGRPASTQLSVKVIDTNKPCVKTYYDQPASGARRYPAYRWPDHDDWRT